MEGCGFKGRHFDRSVILQALLARNDADVLALPEMGMSIL
jgi:hypothetical protein